MIVPIIIAIWFGYRASKARRSVIGWALGGAVLTFVVNTVLANAAILIVAGSLKGPIAFDTYLTIRVITAILTIVAMISIGMRFLPGGSGILQSAGSGLRELQAIELHKEYPTPGEPLAVLRGVSLELKEGESAAILGPSGSGKSTLLNILGTLDRPTRGTLRLGGTDPSTLTPEELARFRASYIGFVFQDHHLLPQCTALENVLLARLAEGKVLPEHIERADDLLKRVGLAARQTHLPSELSGGERQRVAIARAMMNRPALLLCDEPTGNLDAKTSQAIGGLLAELAHEGRTMLVIVTHSVQLAARFDRRLRMEEGKLVSDE